MVVGTISIISFSATEGRAMHCAGVVVSRPYVTIYSGHRRIQNNCWRCTDARPRGWVTTSRFLSRQLKPTEQRYLAYK